jgi:hypothetical protein
MEVFLSGEQPTKESRVGGEQPTKESERRKTMKGFDRSMTMKGFLSHNKGIREEEVIEGFLTERR